MINRRTSVWLIPLILIVTFPLWKIPVGDFLAPRGGYDPHFASRKVDVHHFIIDKADIIQSENGKKTADIKAKEALTGKKPNDIILITVNASIFGQNGETTKITAQNGLYNTVSKRLTLTGNVVVVRKSDHYRLYTNLLDYYDKAKKVVCPGKTKVIGDGVQIVGGSMSYYLRTKTYNVGPRVHTVIQGFGKP